MKHVLTFVIGIIIGSIVTDITIGKNTSNDSSAAATRAKKNYIVAFQLS